MPTTEARLTSLENSVIKLASNKLDITDHNTWTSAWNAQYLDLLAAVNSLKRRVDSLEEKIINIIETG